MEVNIFTQPELPYAPDALAPAISEETISYHWGKHEKTYIENLNKLVRNTQWEDMPLEEIIRKAQGPLFNNASQAWNHIFYFFSFSPDGGGEPDGELADAIKRDFGSFDEFKKLFVEAGTGLLVQDGYGCRRTKMVSFLSLKDQMRQIQLPTGLNLYSLLMYGSTLTISITKTVVPRRWVDFGISWIGK